jgi:DNA-binding GntR family transcriptional regulator
MDVRVSRRRGAALGPEIQERRPGQLPVAGLLGLPELDRSSLRDRARKAILGSIVTGEIGDDEIYPVSYFSSHLGVSATPVREALFDLAGDGLVELVPKRGFRIPQRTDRELDELYELRIMLEVPAVGRLAVQPGGLDFPALRQLTLDMIAQAESRQVAEFLWADRTFHLTILEGQGNRQLVELVARLRDRTRLQGISQMATSGVLIETAREHVELLDSLTNHDGPSAEDWMRHHLRHIRGTWAGRKEEAVRGPGPSSPANGAGCTTG